MRVMDGRKSLIGLLTDFGTRDPYVASMRGVIASRTDAFVEDLSHDIAPFDTFEAAVFLHGCLAWLPSAGERYSRVLICVVVDPGVGSDRAILIVRSEGRLLLAPDNGVLMPLLSEADEVFSFRSSAFDLDRVSTTFHGRDRIAPVAAALSNGVLPEELAAPMARDALVAAPWWPPIVRDQGSVTGTVIAVDRFGNCVTDVCASDVPPGSSALIRSGARVNRRFGSYAGARGAGPFMITGSRGTIEIAVSEASAADLLQLSRGDRVRFDP